MSRDQRRLNETRRELARLMDEFPTQAELQQDANEIRLHREDLLKRYDDQRKEKPQIKE